MITPQRAGFRRTLFAGAALAILTPLSARAQLSLDSYRLPSGQFLTPAAAPGASFSTLDPGLASYPGYGAGGGMTGVVSPDGRTLLVLTSGYNSFYVQSGPNAGNLDPASAEYLFVYDISAHKPVRKQVISLPASFAGIVFSPDGGKFYVGSGGGDSVLTYARSGGSWAQDGAPIALGHASGVGNNQGPSTAGLAITADGRKLAVANIFNDSVSLIDLTTGKVSGELDLRPGVENASLSGTPGGETPFWIAVHGSTAYVTAERDREVDVLDISGATPKLTGRIAVTGNPIEAVLNKAGTRLYVAADNADDVHVIDTATNSVIDSIPVEAPDGLLAPQPRYRGVAPNALALSADEKTLYVSNGGENAVAVVRLGRNPHTVALLPTGWYPNSVAVSNGWLYAVNEKSDPGPNPLNCQGSLSAEPTPPPYAATCSQNQYILQLSAGGLLAEPIPTTQAALNLLTLTVGVDDNFIKLPNPVDQVTMAALHSRIKHVIYIVKENRTYDQILGDLGEGNGDPSLVEFGAAITPNFHAISKHFVDLDNFYDTGEVSGNGWPWSTSARETDFNIKTIPLNYSSLPTNAPYDAEGQVRNVDVGIATTAGRKAADPAYPNDPNFLPGTNNDDAPDGPDDDGANGAKQNGYLWNAAVAAGLSVRNYGFLLDLDRYGTNPSNYGASDTQIPEDVTPYADKVVQAYSTTPGLVSLTDPYFRGFDNAYPDYDRVQEWMREFNHDETTNSLPSLTLLRLMHDHMGNFSTALDKINTPELEQADNDYAVGLVAQRVAQSRDAGDTLIFVLEDDAQDGPDHVDAHRSTAYVIGPYVKQGAVVSERYTTVSMLTTIEDVLGIGHLNINDANARPMTEVFDLSKAAWSYKATPSQYLYSTTLPLPTRQADAGPIPMSTHDASWWAAATKGYDWSHEDRVPTAEFNRVLWRGLMGNRPYTTVRDGFDVGRVVKVSVPR